MQVTSKAKPERFAIYAMAFACFISTYIYIYIIYFMDGFTMFHRKTARPFSVTRILHVMAYRVCRGNGGTLEKRPRFLSEILMILKRRRKNNLMACSTSFAS